jgi:hypothetical protein
MVVGLRDRDLKFVCHSDKLFRADKVFRADEVFRTFFFGPACSSMKINWRAQTDGAGVTAVFDAVARAQCIED